MQDSGDGFLMEKRDRTIRIATILIVLFSSVAALYPFASDAYSEYEIRQQIRQAYNLSRPGGGRLSGIPYVPSKSGGKTSSDLGRAQVFVLRHPEMKDRQKLQGMIYLASGEWRALAENHSRLKVHSTSESLNNLGVSFLALSEDDPTFLLEAVDRFEKAIQLDSKAVEPHFNLVLSYRRLRLPRLANESLERYIKLDSESAWYRELTENEELDDSDMLSELRRVSINSDLAEAEKLFDANPVLFRAVAMQYGLASVQESPALVRFIGEQFERRFGDRTISAMLAPLFTDRRENILKIRELVTQGAEMYLQGNLDESLEAYSRADELAAQEDSAFDHLWIDLNRIDTWIRAGEFELARDSLHRAITVAEQHHFLWLQAKALSIYGTTLRLTTGYAEMLERLTQADRMFVHVQAESDRVRPLYYLAVYQWGAGDQDQSLKLALQCLRLTREEDVVRMSQLDWLIGVVLYRKGRLDKAVLFQQESLEQAQKTRNPTLETTAAWCLAQLFDFMSEKKLAEQYLTTAEDAYERIPAGLEQSRAKLSLNMVRARLYLNQARPKDAESLLEAHLNSHSQRPFQEKSVLSQSLMLLARAYSETGQLNKATRKFNEAIEAVENDDHYLESEKLRIKFDDERRELYDAAINFEYNLGSPDAAWTYIQKYRAKLFLEFLAQFNPHIQQIRTGPLTRARVEKLIPADTQIIEYALLKDRLLIWVLSDKLFTLRSVPVSRSELEGDVQTVLQKLRTDSDADHLLEKLGKILIEPVVDLLDSNRTIAIIPDRVLHGLPFGALRIPSSSNAYLIQKFPVIVSPSLTHLLATDAARPQRDAIVGFGSQFDDSSEIKELDALRTIYKSSVTLAGANIDKAKFLAAMNTSPIVHYAGHSATDAVDPLRSSILLDGNRYGPNSVTAVDISQQRLWKNALVVLSSCDSSVGNSRDGVGMRGLTSAFLIGGAGSVVGSLWPVEADSTSQLMISFHRAFATGQMPVAQALRQAQLAFLESFPERSHPYYWSGFVVTGNFSALR
jgi:CHAT domain-containing protein